MIAGIMKPAARGLLKKIEVVISKKSAAKAQVRLDQGTQDQPQDEGRRGKRIFREESMPPDRDHHDVHVVRLLEA
jgi:hypothetical protein